MALERRDCKVYFDADVHAALKVLADHEHRTLADFIESLVEPVVRKRIHDTMLLSEQFRRAGIFRLGKESPPGQVSGD